MKRGQGLDYDPIVGRTYGPWTVVQDTLESVHGGALYRVRAACCGRETTKNLRSLHSLRKARSCTECAENTQRKHPHLPRGTCAWCSRTYAVKGSRAANECAACQRAANRNGREPDGRPIRLAPTPALRSEAARRSAATRTLKRLLNWASTQRSST